MASGESGAVFQQIHRLFGAGTVAGLAEAQLLERFVRQGDEVAFEAIVARHGPMVLGVCRRVLADPNDVEDAFQATFLILVRKAGSLRDRDLLGNWLYGVAHRVAVRARASTYRRNRFEARSVGAEAVAPTTESVEHDLQRLLDEELRRLPETYRAPIVLCHLEGRTHDQAAEQLGCPVGTVRSRLSRGRERLRKGLTKRGLALSTALLGAALEKEAASAAPAALVQSTTTLATRYAAAGTVPASVAFLTEGVLKSMFVNKLVLATAVVLAVGAIAGGVGAIAQQGPEAAPAKTAVDQPAAKPAAPREDATRTKPATPAGERTFPGMPGFPGAIAVPPGGAGFPGMPGMPKSQISMVRMESLIAVPIPKKIGVMAYSMETGDWEAYWAPKGTRAIRPILSGNLIAVQVIPETEVTRVAVFDAKSGKWHLHDLREPSKEVVTPTVSDNAVVYHVGQRVYVFSGPAGRWSDLDVKESPKPLIFLDKKAVTVEQGSELHVLNLKLGRWASLDTKTE